MGKTIDLSPTRSGKQLSLSLRAQRRVLLAAAKLRQHRASVLILCYHGVSKSDEHVWNPRLYIDARLFRQRLQTIREFGYQVLPLHAALERMREKRLTAPTVVITFDDGWHDFYTVAWPMLREFSYPATVYQTTYYSQYNRPVFDPACAYLLWKGVGRVIEYRGLDGGLVRLNLTQPGAMEQARRDLLSNAEERNWTAQQKDLFLQRLAQGVGFEYELMLRSRTLHLMNERELREIAAAGIDVELHTHRHRLPSSKQLFFGELENNQEFLRTVTRKQSKDFCYPNGEYRPEFVAWLREAGINSATTCEPGRASHRSNPLLLPRLTDASTVSQGKFESWLAGTGLIAPRFKRALRWMFNRKPEPEPNAESPVEPTSQRDTEASESPTEVKISA